MTKSYLLKEMKEQHKNPKAHEKAESVAHEKAEHRPRATKLFKKLVKS